MESPTRIASLRAWALLVIGGLLLLLTTGASAQHEEEELARNASASLLWGPYRPNLYFGVRPRIPKSLMTGLMWSRVDDYTSVQSNFRHTCEQSENMAGYGWTTYDARHGGLQTIHDADNELDLTTSFVKFPGGSHGGSWGLRVTGTPRAGAPPDLKSTVVFSASIEGVGSLGFDEDNVRGDARGLVGDVLLKGESAELGEFRIVVSDEEGKKGGKNKHPVVNHPEGKNRDLSRTMVNSFSLPDEAVWQTKAILFAHLKRELEAVVEKYGQENPPPPWQLYTIANQMGQGNLHFIQKTFEGPFEFDIMFSSGSAPEPVTSDALTSTLKTLPSAISSRFADVFRPQAPFATPKHEEFSRSLFSNLLGGIGYFYGDARVDRSYAPEYEEENEGFWIEAAEARARNQARLEGPLELFTSIPSRPFFPRGFLWDEGFHLLPVLDWDVGLTLEIVKSWFSLMDADGWIAREQILGAEARTKVPPEFQVQYPHYANPPTLFLVLSSLVSKLNDPSSPLHSVAHDASQQPLFTHHTAGRTPSSTTSFLRALYPLLRRQYAWFRRTQRGDLKGFDRPAGASSREAYRWRGRTPDHVLPSGLDDYPRAQPPHPGELHADLMAWVGAMARALRGIAEFLVADAEEEGVVGEEDVAELRDQEEAIRKNLRVLHWSEDEGVWCDATVDEFEEHALVCHAGYVSLMPWLAGLVRTGGEDDELLGRVLDAVGSEEVLWNGHGLRSLSKGDELYGTGENYWRGPVWVNMNYLAVERLLELAQSPSSKHQARAKKLYSALRRNLVDTVFESWKETGFAWEQYNPETGKGQRTQHFTGWTSLVVKIMAMPDLEGGGGRRAKDEL
ncbi:glucosidase I [Lineolata rhizophorae]|uniref:Mannosyl-oligosaccharide glucosidase n=1 Tax=Lineolata rhizophorae TaxID=578093 RepID=A0A6A6NRZ4_9PEZI|nr:glucosidase I [Lineolata rhizophorae]